MKRLFLAAAAASTLTLGGCAYMTLPSDYTTQADPTLYYDPMVADREYVQAVCGMTFQYPEVAVLLPKIPTMGDQATLAQLADRAKPNAAQKKAIAVLDEHWQTCDREQIAYLQRYDTVVYPALASHVEAVREQRAALWAGQITFGQFNTRRAQIVAKYALDTAALRRDQALVDAQYEQARAANQAASAAAAAASRAADASAAAAASSRATFQCRSQNDQKGKKNSKDKKGTDTVVCRQR